MKILVISTWFPFPPDNGSKARTYNLLRHLGARHTLDLLALSQSERDTNYLDEVRQFCRRIALFPEPKFHPRKLRSYLGFFSPTPRYFQAHHCRELESLSTIWTQEESYNVVLAVTLGAGPYAAKLDVPFRVLDQHNIESQVIKRECRNGRSILRRLRYAPTWIKAEGFERAVARRFDAITVVSEQERGLMEGLLGDGHGKEICVVPNGIDPGLLEYQPPMREEAVLLFTGALTYKPNYDAAVRLCEDILPAVRTRFPHARLRITGGFEGVDVSGLADTPGVELTGYVEDIRPVVASASVLVVPLHFGGGTRLKILEAMALGTPVVSTPIGAEGLEVQDGVHILLGETTTELADRTSRVLADPDWAVKIAGNARELVKEHYQWPMIAGRFERVLARSREKEIV